MSPRKEKEPKAPKAPRQDKEARKRAKEDAPKNAIAFGLGRKKTDLTTAFRFSALDQSGKKVSGVEMALSSGAVHMALLERGLEPLEVTTKKSVLAFELTKKKVPRTDVMNFTRQLAVFMKAGIPIMEALEVIVEETQNKLLRQIVREVIDSLRAGDTFAAAASAHPEAFPNFYIGILESAELTGNLDSVLNQLADYIERDTKARSKITAALIYPAVVAAMSVVTVLVLTVFVLPRFTVFFKSLNAKLPLITRMMMSASAFVIHWWYAELGLVIFLVVGFIVTRRDPRGRAKMDAVMLRLPVVGDLTQTAILERTCRILSSMLKAGVDLPRSMAVTADSANNAVYQRALEGVREDMMEGQGLAGPIARTGLFPGAARQMFRVGEETGTLDQQLDVAAEYYNRELEVKLDRATALFEPAIIIFMGVIVGFVAVALISAMYGIYNQVKVG
ncbi:MAG: type II secretion system F family protein [Acidimicrobiales bacterium]|jgi:type IV pilus assembly protein PilC